MEKDCLVGVFRLVVIRSLVNDSQCENWRIVCESQPANHKSPATYFQIAKLTFIPASISKSCDNILLKTSSDYIIVYTRVIDGRRMAVPCSFVVFVCGRFSLCVHWGIWWCGGGSVRLLLCEWYNFVWRWRH